MTNYLISRFGCALPKLKTVFYRSHFSHCALFRWHDWKCLIKKSNAIFLVQLSIIAISLKKLLLNFIGLVKHLPEANSWIANNSEHLGLLFFIPHWALLRFLPISYKSSHKLLHWLGRPPTSNLRTPGPCIMRFLGLRKSCINRILHLMNIHLVQISH